MKTDLTTAGSFAQSKALSGKGVLPRSVDQKSLVAKPPALNNPDYKLDLSGPSRSTPAVDAATVPSVPTPSLPASPSVPDVPAPDLKSDLLKAQARDKAKEEALKKASEVAAPEEKEGSVKKAAIIFIKGLDVFSSPSKSEGGYAGVGKMAQAVDGSRVYGWNQKDEIMKEIKKVHKDYPVVLVGHSLGGDTAIEIADAFDSLEGGFRPIDLLVTIDAIGFSHDIVPQNVKNHLNVFGESSWVLKDGPHVARREEKTQVRNILTPLDHTDIDDNREVQYEIISLIQNTVKK